MDRPLFTIPMIAAALLAIAVAPHAYARGSAQPLVTVSLSIPPTAWDGPVQAVIRFTIEPHWHLYWSNPGDAGLPPTIRWKLPHGFQAGPLSFPTPTKIVADGLLAYGYFDELILVATLTPPPGYRPALNDSIHGGIDWLVCKESCLPGSRTISVPCAGTGDERDAANGLLARFALTAPVPWPGSDADTPFAIASRSDGAITLHFDPGAPVTDFYPDLLENTVVDLASIRVGTGGVSFRALPSGPLVSMTRLRGILISGAKAYSIDVPVHYQN